MGKILDNETVKKTLAFLDRMCEEMLDLVEPVFRWLKRNFIWCFLVVLTIGYIYRSICHFYLDQWTIGEAMSVTFVEIVVIAFRSLAWMAIGYICLWIGLSILKAYTSTRANKRTVLIQDDKQSEREATPVAVNTDTDDSVTEESVATAVQPVKINPSKLQGKGYGKEKPVTVSTELRSQFLPMFVRTNSAIQLNHYDVFVEQLSSKAWNVSDLGRIAYLVYNSNILQPYYPSFSKWMHEFFRYLGREDCPVSPDTTSYNDLTKSRVNLEQMFSDLIDIYEKKGTKSVILSSKS